MCFSCRTDGDDGSTVTRSTRLIYRRMHESKSDSFVRRSSTRPALSSPASGRPTSTRSMFSSFQASSIVVDESLSEMGDSFGSTRSGTRSRTSEGQIVWA